MFSIFKRTLITVMALVAILALTLPTAQQAWADNDIWGEEVSTYQQQIGKEPEANLPFLYAVYTITWAAFFGYIFLLSRRQREMRREIKALRKALEERSAEEKAKEG